MTRTEEELIKEIGATGDAIRVLKAEKKAENKAKLDELIAKLLALKQEFKQVTGKDFGPPPKPKKEVKPKPAAEATPQDPNKKTKKQLNKEKKKEKKQAMKAGGEPAAAEAPKAADKAAKKPQAAAASAPKPLAPVVSVGPTSYTLPKPTEEEAMHIVYCSKGKLPLASYVVASLLNKTQVFRNHINKPTLVPTLVLHTGQMVSGDFAIARYLCRLNLSIGLYGMDNDALVVSQIDSYLDFAIRNAAQPQIAMDLLNVLLKDRTYLLGHAVSLADIGVYTTLLSVQESLKASATSSHVHVARWFMHLHTQPLFSQAAESLLKLQPIVQEWPKASANNTKKAGATDKESFVSQKGKNTGNCPPLEGAEIGQVVTRFPPEPSGYLHIGHVKAAMLNDYYAKTYKGRLIVRFDDTNPSKEKEEFEQSILADLKRLDIVGDVVSYTSDYFPKIIELAKQLIKEGKAYMDNTSQEQMRQERMDGIESKCRNTSPEENLKLFEAMLKNAEEAQGYCLRGKIDMQAKNKTLRDPVFFRVNTTPHHRTGTKYCAYPTYDFCCPIVDSIEGVTHALRTTEYNDRDDQYQWVLQALGLRKVRIHSFARMNFVHSVLSKRKLQWFVDNKKVDGWNDPRFPTLQGVLRRGVQVEALREFILSQGASRRIVDMEWDKFWTVNKRVIDPVANRYFAIDKANAVPLELTNVPENQVVGLSIARHPKSPERGNKVMRFGRHLLLEKDDVKSFAEGEEVTLMRVGNIIVKKLIKDPKTGEITKVEAENHPEGDFKKTKKKITWLAQVDDLVPTTLVEFDFLINKPKLEENDDFQDYLTPVTRAEMHCIGDHEMRNLQKGQVIQLERRGYFCVDEPYLSKHKPLVLFMIPDGKAKAMSTLSTNLAHR